MTDRLFTIGHSNHALDDFITLLRGHGVTCVVDVRSHPYSRRFPHYSREPFKQGLREHGIAYVFLGKELGARSQNPACYRLGKVQYNLLAQEPSFCEGIERVQRGMATHHIALMCAERDPVECHRSVLVSRSLHDSGVSVDHILGDGTLESHDHLESRLLKLLRLPEGDMFKTRAECILEAYGIQGEKIAYTDPGMHDREEE